MTAMAMATRLKVDLEGVVRSHKAQRYPAELRRRAVTVVNALRGEGASWRQVSAAVGLRADTLQRWCGGGSLTAEASLVPVEVVGDRGGVSILSPKGWRVEGLSLADAASLLRSLS